MFVILAKCVNDLAFGLHPTTNARVYASGVGLQFVLWLVLRSLGI
jgi:hypothetical protein